MENCNWTIVNKRGVVIHFNMKKTDAEQMLCYYMSHNEDYYLSEMEEGYIYKEGKKPKKKPNNAQKFIKEIK